METFGQKSAYKLEGADEKHLTNLQSRFVRWQDKQINLLSFSINLLFTLSVASIGLVINNFDKSPLKDHSILGYSLPQIVAFTLSLSALFGILALWSRLFDFRLTTQINRKRVLLFKVENNITYESKKALKKSELETKISCLQCWTEFLGNSTWWLFIIQSVIFLIGIIILIYNLR